jgi:hypothetical protein
VQANSTGVPPGLKSKQSRVTDQSLYKHWSLRKKKKFITLTPGDKISARKWDD